MAKQTINLGTAPSGAGGDTPRSAFTKAQANIDELYAALGGSTLPAALPIVNGGTGATTVAAALASLGITGAYTKANILGTVSQVSGVPTGSAFQFVSNANGSAIKFADGSMIQYGSFSMAAHALSTSASTTVTLPVAFVGGYTFLPVSDSTNGAGSQDSIGALQANGMYQTRSAGSVSVSSYAYRYAQGDPVIVGFSAFGRWY